MASHALPRWWVLLGVLLMGACIGLAVTYWFVAAVASALFLGVLFVVSHSRDRFMLEYGIVALTPVMCFTVKAPVGNVSPHEALAVLALVLRLVYARRRLNPPLVEQAFLCTKPSLWPKITSLDMAVAFFWLSVVVSVLTSQDPENSIFWARGMSGFLLVFLVMRTRSPAFSVRRLAQAFMVAGTASSAWALSQIVSYFAGLSILRHGSAVFYGIGTASGLVVPTITGPFLNPDTLGLFLLFTIPLTLSLYETSANAKSRLVLSCSVLAQGATVILTGSTGCLLGLVLELAFLIAHAGSRRVLSWMMAAVVCVALATGLLMTPTLRSVVSELSAIPRHLAMSLVDYRGDASIAGRLQIWQAAVQVWEDSPIIGSGLGQTTPLVARYLGQSTSTHSLLFSVLGDMGIVGLVTLVFLYGAVLLRVRSQSRSSAPWRGILVSLYAYLVVAVTTGTYVFDNMQVILWAIMGFVASNQGRGH